MQTNQKNQQRSSLIKAFTSAFICFILLMVFYYLTLQHDLDADKERYGYIARNQADHIITTIDCVMSRTNTLKIMVKEHKGDTSWFDDVAEDLYTAIKDETGVSPKNFAIAPNCVVSNI